MPYVGKQPEIGAYKKLDAITVVNGQAAYTLQSGSANYSPASANHLIVSLNGVIQAPQDSFSVSGSTLTFASNLSTGDSIDFILALGDVLNIGTPSDNTVTNDKLATAPTIISKGDGGSTDGAIQLNCSQNTHGVKIKSPPHSAGQSYTLVLPSTAPSANKALITDGSGNLSFGSAGGLTLLNTTTLSSSTSATLQGLMTGYDNYLVLYKLTRSTNSIPRLTFLSGATELTSGYHSQGVYGQGSTVGSLGDDGQSFINLTSTFSSSYGATAPVSGHFYVIDPDDASDLTYVVGQNALWSSSSNLVINSFTGSSTTAQAQDGLKFALSTGNYVDGFIKLYGIS
jgi:hypothetical protein